MIIIGHNLQVKAWIIYFSLQQWICYFIYFSLFVTVCLLALVPSCCRKSKQNNVPRVSLCGETLTLLFEFYPRRRSTLHTVQVRVSLCAQYSVWRDFEEMTACFPLFPYGHACPPRGTRIWSRCERLSFDGAVWYHGHAFSRSHQKIFWRWRAVKRRVIAA